MPTGLGLDSFTVHSSQAQGLFELLNFYGSTLFCFSDGGSSIEGWESRRRWAWFWKFERNLRDGILVAGLLALWLHLCLGLNRFDDRRGNNLNGIRDRLRCRLWSVHTCVRASIKAAEAVVWAI